MNQNGTLLLLLEPSCLMSCMSFTYFIFTYLVVKLFMADLVHVLLERSVEIWRVNRDMVCSATLCSCMTCNLVIARAQACGCCQWTSLSLKLAISDTNPIAGFEHLLVVFLHSFGSFCHHNSTTTYQLIISYLSNYLLTLLAAI